jgi:hypothetical protein
VIHARATQLNQVTATDVRGGWDPDNVLRLNANVRPTAA